MSKVKILIVEDESIVAIDIARRLKSLGYYVLGHTLSGEDAVLFSREKSPDLVLMDIHLKGEIDGITAAEQIRREYDIPVIYITAYSDESTLDRAKVTEPFGYILKPFQEREIHSAIEMAMYKHRAEQELREAKEAAEEGYRARSEFLANISHELRTPLNSILGMTKIAMETEDKDELQEYLKMAKDSGDHLLYLINSLLDFSKMEAGKLVLEEQPFQLDELMEEELYRVWSTEAGEELELYFALDEKSVFSLRGDESRLRQVVRNLVQNAAKFTPSGYVAVEAATRSNNRKGRVELEITVSDTGIGIPEKEKEEIFSLFYKVDNSLTMVHGGTGLGLSIVKNLTDLMGGKISLETEE
ncbi:MAG: hybrid sensor histidine kinase/response regulator, partial [Spirochaetaceae bacterium]